MKYRLKGILAIGLSASVGMVVPNMAFAVDGTITITGNVTSQTCTISGNGGDKNFTVTLPTVSASVLATAGATAGRTPFNIALSKCTPDSGNVSVYFEPGAAVDTTTGRLFNTESKNAAHNVQVGLLNADNSNIQLGESQVAQKSQSVALSGGAATLNYYAQYVATGGAATAGGVTTNTMYSIVYQ